MRPAFNPLLLWSCHSRPRNFRYIRGDTYSVRALDPHVAAVTGQPILLIWEQRLTVPGRLLIYGALLFVGACVQTGSPVRDASPKTDADSIVLPVSAKLAPDPIAAPQKDPAPPVSRCDFSKVLPSDELFENRGYVLTDDAAVLLARDVMIPIASCASLELITVTGYTDHLGPLQSRQTLVEHRAEAIKAFLVAHGIASARVNAVGQADAPPISTGCAAQHHHKLVECLAPDRRIVVQVQGIAR